MTANLGSTNLRNYPDVALTADNIFVFSDDGLAQYVGGTSCAAPLWAAFVALANQQAAAYGRPTLGFINPAIYALGLGENYSNCFHDIVTGNNTWSESPLRFFATPGYDLCSGWGTPVGSNLVNALALDPLQITPPGDWASGGIVGGPFTPASQIYVLTNGGSAALEWSAGVSAPWLEIWPLGGTLVSGGSPATVTASLTPAASNLFLGDYTATIWFTNLSQGTVQTRTVALAVIKPPGILTQPASVSTIGGTTVTFSVSAAGGLPLNCQWQCNGTNMLDDGRISGSQTTLNDPGNIYGTVTTTLTINNVSVADAGTYALVASNASGVIVSSDALLTITPSIPVLVQQPVSQAVLIGATAQIQVAADGTSPFSYQWQDNGTNLADGNNVTGSLTPTLTISGATSANIGTYSVVVSNAIGATTSTGAVLNVQVFMPGGELVENGNFETGSFPPWDESGNATNAIVSASPMAVHSGDYGALLGAAGSLGYLSQPMQTTAGAYYLISLWLDVTNQTAASKFLVAWNGVEVFDHTNLIATGWTNLQLIALAEDSNTVLELGFRDDQGFLGLDDIQVVPLFSADGPPIIATQPISQFTLQGASVTLSVLSSGVFPLFYQWQFDNLNIEGATNASLMLTNLSGNQGGTYDVVVSNSLGTATSSNAIVTVLAGVTELITFDDLPYRLIPVPASYDNLTWSNFYYLNSIVQRTSGYTAGMVSVPKVAYNAGGAPASISASTPFVFNSAYLTAAWYDNLQVEVRGYNGATLLYDNTYTLSAATPTLINFNYLDVTSVQFNSFGGTPHPGYNGSGTEFVMDNVTAYVVPVVPAPPPLSLSLAYTFSGFDGGRPTSALIQGDDGSLYGTTEYGGTNGYGTVFKMTTNGALTTLFSLGPFNNGPIGSLVQGSDGKLYGTTEYGGTNNSGTIFSITTDGMFSTLASFDLATTGGSPITPLVQGADGSFYGTTPLGGAHGLGTAFNVTTNGTLTTLISFDSTNGSNPEAALIQGGDGNFYGTTFLGGTYNAGTIFRMATNGTVTTVVSLDGFNAYPYGAMTLGTDGNLYGTTEEGGSNNFGTLFCVTTNGAFSTLFSFDYYNSGGSPSGSLAQGTDGNLYGTTEEGGSFGTTYFNGTYGGGSIFCATTNGTLTTLFSFENTNGLSTEAGMVLASDGNFYGTAPYGGAGFNGYYNSGDGVIFRLGATALTSAPPAIITQPSSQVVPAGGAPLFAVSANGTAPLNYLWQRNGVPIAGATSSVYRTNNVQASDSGDQFNCRVENTYGEIMSVSPALTIVQRSGPIFSFSGTDGGYVFSALALGADGSFYGTTQYGGANGNGTVFNVTTNGALTTLASLNFYLTGANPLAGLTLGADGNLYGIAPYGGLHDDGTVFRVTTNGVLTVLANFNGNDGSQPVGELIQGADDNFYARHLRWRAVQLWNHLPAGDQRDVDHLAFVRLFRRRLSPGSLAASRRRQFLRHRINRWAKLCGNRIPNDNQRHVNDSICVRRYGWRLPPRNIDGGCRRNALRHNHRRRRKRLWHDLQPCHERSADHSVCF